MPAPNTSDCVQDEDGAVVPSSKLIERGNELLTKHNKNNLR